MVRRRRRVMAREMRVIVAVRFKQMLEIVADGEESGVRSAPNGTWRAAASPIFHGSSSGLALMHRGNALAVTDAVDGAERRSYSLVAPGDDARGSSRSPSRVLDWLVRLSMAAIPRVERHALQDGSEGGQVSEVQVVCMQQESEIGADSDLFSFFF
jgi:hypothetical protein